MPPRLGVDHEYRRTEWSPQGESAKAKRSEVQTTASDWIQWGEAATPPRSYPLARSLLSTRSAVSGSSVTRRPMARDTAFMTAAGVGVIAGSPMPLAPKGPRPVPDSNRMVSTAGASSVVGIL